MSIGLPRIVALSILNTLGITAFNHLPTLRFGLNEVAREQLTEQYDHALATNFRPHDDYADDIRRIQRPLRIVAGTDDELFHAARFASVFKEAGHAVPVTLLPGVNHMGLTLNATALRAVVEAANLE